MARREQLEAMLADDPNDPFLLYALALEVVKEGERAAGLERLRSLSSQHPDYVPSYFRQGQLLAEDGDTEEARAVLTTGISVAQRVGDAHAAGEMRELLEML